ncbi:sulfite exporter TauE/SafE family protein [Mesorhizobium sp. M2C.T.Ca.TU.002.02.1.1]|uniref:nickel/cobalt transporter n=1 Tax=Mesorhizobium sp. M2C.T.Ca.TU.002.02.1.1 TaxID=2496788 RepID=UPI000FCB78EB|nr:sulfite exporter TauE/SafE family protein [Mesorhizobium sp. M2C.T.Ca.TU.002.02.1.1]RUU56555.1 ABC transporter permease [Mesorhizobium sp. M2C.T.Ca.TU.002.02.1.1]RUU62667.1 ABC transporter permease [Mesorhizobium sp. M2C.T.Ca.TU.009.01.2.1]
MIQALFDYQREIYLEVARHLKAFASDGSWFALFAVLPMGVVFGAAHALTPGHSKTLLAAYITGSQVELSRGLLASLALSFTHITLAVLIAVLALPLVSIALGSVGRAPALETLSRGLLGLVGVWMVWRALRGRHDHHIHEGEAVGVMAGLIPCPLTLFVMTYAISRGIPWAGLVFAVAMMAGVAITLGIVVLLAVLFRRGSVAMLERFGSSAAGMATFLEIGTGLILVGAALHQVFR